MTDNNEPAQGPYPPSSMSIAGLRIFESVARLSSFSRAAEELHVSQPYISNQVHELEAKLRVQLFRRVGRRAYLTESGILLNRHANDILQKIAASERETAELREVIVGRLDIASVVIAAEHVLPQALSVFRMQNPEVTLNLQVYNSRQVEEAVADGRFELGVTLSHSPSGDLNAEQFGVDELVVVVGKNHRLAAETAIDPQDLSHETLLVRESSSGTRLFIESQFSKIGTRLTYGLELNNNQVIKALVGANFGVAILSSRTVAAEISSGSLTSLKVRGLALERPLTLVSRKKFPLSAPSNAFRSSLLATILRRE